MSSRWFQVSLTEANIYVVANPPLRSGSPKRTKKRIATVPHLDLDFDIDGEARLISLRASDTVPAPTAVLSTSLDKCQILWRVDGFTFEQQKSTLKLLTIAFGSDPACTDCNRILHVPGLLNCEYDPAYPVSVEYSWDSTWNPDDFWLDISARNAMLSSRQSHRESIPVCTRIPNTTGCGFLHELAHGNGAAEQVIKEACSWGGVHGFCTGIEGMILHSISWWCGHGASHRRNFDTPPLKGSC